MVTKIIQEGLDELRAFNFRTRKALPVYADQKTMKDVKGQYHYLFAEERYPGTASLDTYEIDKEAFHVAGIEVLPVEVFHGDMPIRGFRIGNAAYLDGCQTHRSRGGIQTKRPRCIDRQCHTA